MVGSRTAVGYVAMVRKTSRNNRIDFIELPAQDPAALARAKQFFGAVFGWKYQDWGGDYADTGDSGIGSGINADADHRPHSPLLVVYAEDLEAMRERIVGAKAQI